MAAVFILNVPEFAGLVDSISDDPSYTVSDVGTHYRMIERPGELVFGRRAAGFGPAIWYGAFTGGVVGTIVEFGRDQCRIVDAEPKA